MNYPQWLIDVMADTHRSGMSIHEAAEVIQARFEQALGPDEVVDLDEGIFPEDIAPANALRAQARKRWMGNRNP